MPLKWEDIEMSDMELKRKCVESSHDHQFSTNYMASDHLTLAMKNNNINSVFAFDESKVPTFYNALMLDGENTSFINYEGPTAAFRTNFWDTDEKIPDMFNGPGMIHSCPIFSTSNENSFPIA